MRGVWYPANMNRSLHQVTLDPRDTQDGTDWGMKFPAHKLDNGVEGGIAQTNLASEFERQVPGLRGLAQRHVRFLMSGRQQFGPIDFLNIDNKDTMVTHLSLSAALLRLHIQITKDLGAEFYTQTFTTLNPREGRRLWFVGWCRGEDVKQLGNWDPEHEIWRVPLTACRFPDELFEIFRQRYPNV